ncbi:uncharacterized protein LOC116196106 [Punica granatum]|uniref:Uncharacterized protein n=2 Tax=Punica granatum TaxID=22663 RepID=A0A218X7R0_PUNGR|nr:uncharacterized protein LOC116196106 [Punica granatum]OWM80987.1 hypothetical protein CDL15_Pgr007018 [Punica granatum]PKI35005.1 hypothetical protein CRG98_044590 [Punica granatum]
MGYLRRPKDAKARSRKPDGRCRRHPKHQQAPGVCSLCLREKLSQLSIGSGGSCSSSSRGVGGDEYSSCSSSSSLSPYESSSSCSSLSSPVHRYRLEKGPGLLRGKDVLMKSRSIAFVPRWRGKEVGDQNKGKGGFWSKLIPVPGRKTAGSGEGLKHSKTVRERMTMQTKT